MNTNKFKPKQGFSLVYVMTALAIICALLAIYVYRELGAKPKNLQTMAIAAIVHPNVFNKVIFARNVCNQKEAATC